MSQNTMNVRPLFGSLNSTRASGNESHGLRTSQDRVAHRNHHSQIASLAPVGKAYIKPRAFQSTIKPVKNVPDPPYPNE